MTGQWILWKILAFLQARAQDIGYDQAKLVAFNGQISTADISSLLSKVEYKEKWREWAELMKPYHFQLEFSPLLRPD